MSRLIVKNLPKKITEEKIRNIFSEKGTITDVQLKYTEDGKFRQFAFIGYQNENEADSAIKSFDNTFINTHKITVEKCALLGDSNKPKPWSKYAADSKLKKNVPEPAQEVDKPKKKKDKGKKDKTSDETKKLLEKYKDDPMFEEYLQIHAPKESEQLFKVTKNTEEIEDNNNAEDSAIDSGQESPNESDSENEKDKIADQKISDLEYMKKLIKNDGDGEDVPRKPRQKMEKKIKEKIQLFTVKLRGLPYNCKKKNIKHFFKPNTPYTIRIPPKVHGIAYVGFKTEKQLNKALLKDRSFMDGKQIQVAKYKTNNEEETKEEDKADLKKSKWKSQEEALKHEEDIAESGRIFIRNLAYTTTEEDIEKLFVTYGPLAEINLPIDTTTRKSKGFAVVTYLMPEHAVKAYSDLDGTILQGRMLHLLPGKNKDTPVEDNLEESSNYKQKKAAKQKAQAGSSHNWNSLFLGHDAVAEVIADTFGTSKERVLAPHSDSSAAVRLALGETQIVAQTRKYLEEEGVILDTFNSSTVKRSKTVILVKNLPARTEVTELRKIFESHGVVGRIILPPSGITAIIEFLEPSEARKAFTRLAYSKFKNMPLYLEWAPENSLTEKKFTKTESSSDTTNTQKQDLDNNENVSKEEDTIEDEEPEGDTTLFVKNLNFQTTDESLKKHFEGCGKIHYATVATKKDKSNPENKLSMGYGFVRFIHKASADKALKTLQQSSLDGKSLELKRSERTLQNDVKSTSKKSKLTKQTGTKILVRNVPFQANKKEITELFSVFGEIKALRLPKKLAVGSDGHRGFAFVDYVTAGDAKKAFEALSQSTHLYGRRLVLEWASTEENVEELRKRTADHFKPVEEVKSKKSVFSIE